MGSLVGKRALVTAAGQGIGKSIAKGLLKAGCDVALHYFSNAAGADEVAALAKSLGRKAQRFQADLTDEGATIAMVRQAADFLGGLDVLVNNAGGLVARRSLGEVDLSFWQKVIDVNIAIE